MHRPPDEIVIAFVAGQRKIFEIRRSPVRLPVVITQGREKAVDIGSLTKPSFVRVNKTVVILANCQINRIG